MLATPFPHLDGVLPRMPTMALRLADVRRAMGVPHGGRAIRPVSGFSFRAGRARRAR